MVASSKGKAGRVASSKGKVGKGKTGKAPVWATGKAPPPDMIGDEWQPASGYLKIGQYGVLHLMLWKTPSPIAKPMKAAMKATAMKTAALKKAMKKAKKA